MRAAGVPYARVRILGVVSLVLTTVYKGYFDGLGQTRAHMWAAIAMNAANIALNYALIFGAGPLPALGVTGAAVASLISTFIGLAILIAWSRAPSWRAIPVYAASLLSRRTSWELIKLSAPSAAAQLFIMSGVLLFLKIIGALDARAIHDLGAALTEPGLGERGLASPWGASLAEARPSVFTAAAKLIIDLLSIGFVTCIAFGTATSTLVSKSLGRGEPERAADYGWDSVALAAVLFGAVGALRDRPSPAPSSTCSPTTPG